MSSLQSAVLALSLGVLVAACSPTPSSWVDSAMEAVINGQRFRGIGADNFAIEAGALGLVGTTDPAPAGLKPEVYRFSDIPARVYVMFATDGTPFVFVPASILTNLPAPSGAGSDPLAGRMPELCRHWRDPKPSECAQP